MRWGGTGNDAGRTKEVPPVATETDEREQRLLDELESATTDAEIERIEKKLQVFKDQRS